MAITHCDVNQFAVAGEAIIHSYRQRTQAIHQDNYIRRGLRERERDLVTNTHKRIIKRFRDLSIKMALEYWMMPVCPLLLPDGRSLEGTKNPPKVSSSLE
jgi:hypothetical protein